MRPQLLSSCRALVAALSFAVFAATPSWGLPILDQTNLILPTMGSAAVVTSQSLAQSFTVGIDGRLSQIDVQLWKTEGATGDDVLFRLLQTLPDGSPDTVSAPLYETVIPLDDIAEDVTLPPTPPIQSIDVATAGVFVSPGDVLAFSLSRDDVGAPPWVVWAVAGVDVYHDGRAFDSATGPDGPWEPFPGNPLRDLGFQTYVTIPEPASLLTMLSGAMVVAGGRRRFS